MSKEEIVKFLLQSSSDSDDNSNVLFGSSNIKIKEKGTRNSAKRRRPISKQDAPWQKMLDGYQKGENSIGDPETRDGKYFRRRFRMPYTLFLALIQVILDEAWFPKYGRNGDGPLDCTKNRGASLHVKVLSALRVLGRGVIFDECFDGSGCGEESIRVFFHSFTARCCGSLFQSVIVPPKTPQEIGIATRVYEKMGMGPALASTDCTHIELGNCPHNFRIVCTGKSGKPTLSYSLSCSHQRKIYHITSGFAGSKNDKHISKLDSFITAVGKESIYRNFEWTLDVTETKSEKKTGVFIICDGGYHKWAHMICGLKVIVFIYGLLRLLSLISHYLSAHFKSCAHALVCSNGIRPKRRGVHIWHSKMQIQDYFPPCSLCEQLSSTMQRTNL
jgi:hypothetical protein